MCPLCNSPVPVKKGEIPDVVVGAHMDGECRRPPGQETAKVRQGRGCRFLLGEERSYLLRLITYNNFCIKLNSNNSW